MNSYKKQKRNRKIIIIVTSVLIVFSAISLIISRSGTGLENILKDSVAIVEYYVIKKPVEFVSGLFGEYAELKDVYEENRILKEKLDSFAKVEANNQVLKDELERLQELMDMDYLPTDFKTKTASVITRSADGWNNEIVINVGSLGGVEVDMVVVSSKGMIGVVTSTTEVSATVTLLTNEKSTSQLSVKIINGDQSVFGLLDTYNVEDGTYEVSLLADMEELKEDAKVYTSGLGKSPEGILIGTASEISLKSDGTTTKLTVKPAADFTNLGFVSVIQRVNNND